MKKITLLFVIIVSIFSGCQKTKFDSTFSFEPIKPQLSEPILVKFLADGTKLSESNSINMILYQYDVDLLNTSEIAMKKEGNGWTATFTPKKETKGIIVAFKNNEIVENNNSNGFIIYLNNSEGDPLPEAIAGYYVALSQWGTWYADLKSDYKLTSAKFEDIFQKYPQIKVPYLDFYLYTLTRIGTEEAMSKLAKELVLINNNPRQTEEGTVVLAKYLMMTERKNEVKIYKGIILEKYPQNKYAAQIANDAIMSSSSPEKLRAGFRQFLNDFPESELVEVTAYRVIKKFIDENDFDGAIETANEFKEITHPYGFIYSTSKIIEANKNEKALKMIQIGIEASKNNLANPKSTQPKFLTKSAWNEERESYYAELLKIKSTIQSDLGNKNEALATAEEAQSFLKGEDVKLNELYSTLLIEAGQFKKGKEVIEKYLTENKGNATMLEQLEIAFNEINRSNSGFEEYVSKFSAVGEAKLIEKLKTEMLNEPAPEFELNDIDGNIVNFSDYKGKTVIVDFWATWCGPCKRSFPAMQEANDKFKDDKNVEFLFINSWERVENKIENAKEFIKNNGYKLTVLMDIKNEVITKFKVTGIPTKFIIGPDQNIKFKSVGFAGTNEELVKELTAMIKLVNGE